MPSAKFEIKGKCQYCGNTFIAKTLDSKYCSRRCSQRAYDQREAAKKRMSQLNDIVENIPEARDYISVHEAVAMFGISRDTILHDTPIYGALQYTWCWGVVSS